MHVDSTLEWEGATGTLRQRQDHELESHQVTRGCEMNPQKGLEILLPGGRD